MVGEGQEKFYVHEPFLIATSAFLKNALKPQWKGRGEKSIALPDSSAVAFGIYSEWLYTGHINIIKELGKAEPQSKSNQVATSEVEWTKWGQCYELGQFLQDADFTDALIDFAIAQMNDEEQYIDSLPKIIYPLTPKNSLHRKLVVEIATKVWLPISLKNLQSSEHPMEFLADLSIAMSNTFRDGGVKSVGACEFFKNVDTCKYHGHTVTKTPYYKAKCGLT